MKQKLKNYFHKLQSILANIRYGFPARDLVVIGVTGTDGKTTTVSLIYHILKSSGLKVGMISTIEVKVGDKSYDSGLHITTPEPWDMPKYLKYMKDSGITHVVIEATSFGLHQNRLHSIIYDAAAITNIREDHLDYHKTWENYAEAKFSLVEKLKSDGLAVLNSDDTKSADWISKRSERIKNTVYARWITKKELDNLAMSVEGLSFEYKASKFKVPILGEHNFENLLQAIALCERYVQLEKIQTALVDYKTPLGRMQVMQSKPFSVIVDFAHTPNALLMAMESLNVIRPKPESKIICVFGCAGKRDKGRRKMGAVSARLADITILTAEDPRNEEVGIINNDILKYAEMQGGQLVDRFPTRKIYTGLDMNKIKSKIQNVLANGAKPIFAFDENKPRNREDAIDFAFKLAKKGDIVFITGKGHEKSMAFGDPEIEYSWSDQKVVQSKLAAAASEA